MSDIIRGEYCSAVIEATQGNVRFSALVSPLPRVNGVRAEGGVINNGPWPESRPGANGNNSGLKENFRVMI